MKAPSDPIIEQLLRDPQAREAFRRQIKAGTGVSAQTGRQTIELPDVRAGNGSVVRLIIVPAKIPA